MCNTIQIGVREVRWQSGDEDPEVADYFRDSRLQKFGHGR